MLKKIMLVFYIFLFWSNVSAQNEISGKTFNQDNVPLSGTHIHVNQKTVSTDVSGRYTVGNVADGNTKIHVSFIGYQTIDTIVNVKGNMQIDFYLKQNTGTLQEVLVKQKSAASIASVPEHRIRQETIERYTNLSLGDALKEVSGVSSLKTGSTVVKPVIHGLYGSRVPVISNNVRLEDQEWGSEHAPNFDINAAGRITVVKGASGLQYGGDAVGGLVIVEPISIKKDTLFGRTIMSYNTNGRGGTVTSGLSKGNLRGWVWNVLGTFKYFGDRESPDYVLSNSGNREANFSGDLKYIGKHFDAAGFYSYYNATIGILSASHTGNSNDLYNSINNNIPSVINDFTYAIANPKQEVQHHLAKLNYNYYFDETMSLGVQYAFQMNKRLEFDVRRGDYSDIAALDLDLKTHTLNMDFRRKTHDWTIKSGISSSFQNNYASPSTGIRPLIPNYDKVDFGAYGVVRYDLSEKFSIDGGLRYDHSAINATKYYVKTRWAERGYDAQFAHFIVGESGNQWLTKPAFVFNNISASLGLHKEFDTDLNLYANLSLASRNPNPSEFFSDGLHHSTGIIELGDLGLEKEQSVKLAATLQRKWKSFSVEISPYVNNISNYMFLSPVGFERTIRGEFPVWEYRQTTGRLSGIDVQTNWDITPQWVHGFGLSYVRGQDLDANQPLIDMPPLNVNNKLQFSRPRWHNLKLELKSEVVFRQNRFPDNNFPTNIVVNGEFVPVIVDISTPPPAYHLLHFYSEVKFKASKSVLGTVSFSVQNLLNTKYRDYLNRQRFYTDEIGRNFQIQFKFNY